MKKGALGLPFSLPMLRQGRPRESEFIRESPRIGGLKPTLPACSPWCAETSRRVRHAHRTLVTAVSRSYVRAQACLPIRVGSKSFSERHTANAIRSSLRAMMQFTAVLLRPRASH
ncbi:hypothetical protein D3C85_906440 [compost metagenome]